VKKDYSSIMDFEWDEDKRQKNIKKHKIDFSDIPETDEAFWKNAKVVWPNKKTSISIRLDTDILSFFKKQGRGYQSKINAVLRSYVEHQQTT
jgi:uncharacterized protein (DUF4415 family)